MSAQPDTLAPGQEQAPASRHSAPEREASTDHHHDHGDDPRSLVGNRAMGEAAGHLASLPTTSLPSMQRSVGNQAIAGAFAVQRCGPTPCNCSPAERAAHGG